MESYPSVHWDGEQIGKECSVNSDYHVKVKKRQLKL